MPPARASVDEWRGFSRDDLDYCSFPAGASVLDVGCGQGHQLRRLRDAGCVPVGIDNNLTALATLRADGFDVLRGQAECLPVADHSVDGIVCKVVLPYTDERAAIDEWARVLRPGGLVRACYHGAGYYLRYAFGSASLARRVYGLRSLVNGWVYGTSGRRLPGFVGDTIYQSGSRLRRYYDALGFRLEEEWISPRFLGSPVFIFHVLYLRGHDQAAPSGG